MFIAPLCIFLLCLLSVLNVHASARTLSYYNAVHTRVSSNDIQSSQLTYVALGDSVAAGAGLLPVSAPTDVDQLCDRSDEAYPLLLAAMLHAQVQQFSCIGAKVDEGIYGSQTLSNQQVPAQLNEAFKNTVPDMMTITIGANDIRWNQFIRQCYVLHCGGRVDDVRLKVYRADLRLELTKMLLTINNKSNGTPPRVYVSGYYNPIADTSCLGGDRISADEAAWLRKQSEQLNQAIVSIVSHFNMVTFVPLNFTGHELCSSDSWVQGLTEGAPIHPTSAGQRAIATAFYTAMR